MKWNEMKAYSDSKQTAIKNKISRCIIADALCEATKCTAAHEIGIIIFFFKHTFIPI